MHNWRRDIPLQIRDQAGFTPFRSLVSLCHTRQYTQRLLSSAVRRGWQSETPGDAPLRTRRLVARIAKTRRNALRACWRGSFCWFLYMPPSVSIQEIISDAHLRAAPASQILAHMFAGNNFPFAVSTETVNSAWYRCSRMVHYPNIYKHEYEFHVK